MNLQYEMTLQNCYLESINHYTKKYRKKGGKRRNEERNDPLHGCLLPLSQRPKTTAAIAGVNLAAIAASFGPAIAAVVLYRNCGQFWARNCECTAIAARVYIAITDPYMGSYIREQEDVSSKPNYLEIWFFALYLKDYK